MFSFTDKCMNMSHFLDIGVTKHVCYCGCHVTLTTNHTRVRHPHIAYYSPPTNHLAQNNHNIR